VLLSVTFALGAEFPTTRAAPPTDPAR
jgi:hypothetical protein